MGGTPWAREANGDGVEEVQIRLGQRHVPWPADWVTGAEGDMVTEVNYDDSVWVGIDAVVSRASAGGLVDLRAVTKDLRFPCP